MSMVKAASKSRERYLKPSSVAVRRNVTASHPHKAPNTACNGDGPSPLPPCGTGSSSTIRPNSPKSATVRMLASLCADRLLRRTNPPRGLSATEPILHLTAYDCELSRPHHRGWSPTTRVKFSRGGALPWARPPPAPQRLADD